MKSTRASSAARFVLIASALLLPSLSLVPLGGMYLWEKGYLLWWAIASTVIVTTVFLLQRWLLLPATRDSAVQPQTTAANDYSANPSWSAAEQRAWADVKAIAAAVKIEKLNDASSVFELGHHTVNAVARRIHPEKSDALWQFTMPEALAISERVSLRLGRFIESNIPFGDRLTVSQVLTVYSWRSVADVAEKAYDIWRIIRLANPATAVTHEARERLSKAMLTWGREHVTRRLAETFVEEVGRAAIDLYGGRLKISHQDITGNAIESVHPSGKVRGQAAPAMRILVGGRAPEYVDAVTAALTTLQRSRDEAVMAYIRGETSNADVLGLAAIDIMRAKSTGDTARDITALATESETADIVAWIRRDGGPIDRAERSALAAIAGAGPAIAPIILPVIFQPAGTVEDAVQMTSSVAAFTRDLNQLYAGHVAAPVVTVAASADTQTFPAHVLTALNGLAADVRRIQIVRNLEVLKQRRDWSGSARQAASAAGSLLKSVIPGRARKS
ncbi:MAG: hypothetical protein ABL897_14310 [Hyphomicrobium sp.]